MAVTYDAAVKTIRMTATRDYFADGTLEIMTAADVVLVVFGLSANGGSIAGAVWTLGLDNDTVPATAAGTAAKAQIKRSVADGGAAHITGLTVGKAGSDIILSSVAVVVGQNITLSSATITHAP